MSLKIIRPVGNPICLKISDITSDIFSDFNINYYQSGTSALAASIIASIQLKPGVIQPEVILPAYGCPDLISAVIYAGAKPILVDLGINTHFISIDNLANAFTSNTVALIAVRFLGLHERISKLKEICSAHQVVVIEDSAQGFPQSGSTDYWQGDYTTLSFGRGKPVNLLGGGAVITRSAILHKHLPILKNNPIVLDDQIKYFIKAILYNFSIRPLFYGLVCKLPWLQIGETIFKPLNVIEAMPAYLSKYLHNNISEYQARINNALLIHNELTGLGTNEIIDLPGTTNFNFSNQLLRYPILAPNAALRDKLYKQLAPYGASLMYKTSLPKIDGVQSILMSNAEFPVSQDFSGRLLTLPTHAAVNKELIHKIMKIIKSNT